MSWQGGFWECEEGEKCQKTWCSVHHGAIYPPVTYPNRKPKCECGGAKTSGTHSHWCPVHPDQLRKVFVADDLGMD